MPVQQAFQGCKLYFILGTPHNKLGTLSITLNGQNTHKMTFLITHGKPVCQKVAISTNYPHTGKTRGGHRDTTIIYLFIYIGY